MKRAIHAKELTEEEIEAIRNAKPSGRAMRERIMSRFPKTMRRLAG